MSKLIILSAEQIKELSQGSDLSLEVSPRRTIVLGTVSLLDRKKSALKAKFEARMADLERKAQK